MFCRFCGKNILDDSTFCPYCGKSIVEAQSEKEKIDVSDKLPDDEYYKKKASRMPSDLLIKVTKIICYIALGLFLLFNIKMAPSYGWMKILLYAITSGIAIGLVVLFHKKVLLCKTKSLYIVTLLISIFVIVASISLRIVYESKVDYATSEIPSSGEISISLSEKTEYYNSTGTGTIVNPSTHIRIGDKWYKGGDKIPITLNHNYSLRVGSGGSGSGGYTDDSITFNKGSFSQGKYRITKDVSISSGPASMAKVNLTFERYCTFWEVIFY